MLSTRLLFLCLDSGLATDIDHFIIGDTVYVNGDPAKRGKICFIGEVDFAKGDFAGVALDLPMGTSVKL